MVKRIILNWSVLIVCMLSAFGFPLFLFLPVIQIGLSCYNLLSTHTWKKCAILQINMMIATIIGNGAAFLIYSLASPWDGEGISIMALVFMIGITLTSKLCLIFSLLSFVINRNR